MKTALVWLATFLLLPIAGARCQVACYDLGSTPVAAAWEASPVPLGCAFAPSWPQWHLFTPPHRRPAVRIGYNPGPARPRPRVLVVYRCTGLRLLPVAIDRVRYMGYVIDQPELPCQPDG